MRIALCGEARSGKDTVASLVKNDFCAISFGYFMKKGYFRDNPHMVDKPKDREDMINWSQPKVEVYNRIWIDPLEAYIEGLETGNLKETNWIITDLRQPHEEQWCRDNGFHIVRVHSCTANLLKRRRELGEKLSENDLPYWVNADYHIYNDGSLEDLKRNVNKLLKVLTTHDKIKTVTEEVNTYGHTKEDLNSLSKLMHCGDE